MQQNYETSENIIIHKFGYDMKELKSYPFGTKMKFNYKKKNKQSLQSALNKIDWINVITWSIVGVIAATMMGVIYLFVR